MSFIADLLPPSRDIEAAAALALAMSERKSKGLFSRKQYEQIEVLAPFALPLKTVTWTPGETSGRCLAFDLQGLVSGGIRFDLEPKIPETEFDPEAGEEDFLALCQQWTKMATEFTPSALEFVGLITQPDQVAPLLKGDEDPPLLAGLEKKADPEGTLAQLLEQLAQYEQAAAAWSELKQKAYAHRDILAAKIQQYAEEDREAGNKSLADLSSQVETAIAAKGGETEGAIAAVQEECKKRREMLQAELDRFQEGFKENGDAYWRDQIKAAEKSLAENDKLFAKKQEELEGAFKSFEYQQQSKIHELKAELEKRLATFDARLKRLDAALDGFSKGLEKRLALYEQQPSRVHGATVEISNERCAQDHYAVFHAALYPGGRWLVFPPQIIGSRGIIGAVSGLFGGLNLPFKPASKLAEILAEKMQKLLPGSDLETNLTAANLLQHEDFFLSAKAGLGKLIDQGKIDKKHANLFADIIPSPDAEGGDSPLTGDETPSTEAEGESPLPVNAEEIGDPPPDVETP